MLIKFLWNELYIFSKIMKIFSKIMKGVCIIGTTFELNGENSELFFAMVVAKIHMTNASNLLE